MLYQYSDGDPYSFIFRTRTRLCTQRWPNIIDSYGMYLKHQNCMYLCYCWRCGFIFSCQSWKTIPTGILCQTRYWTDKPKLTASTLNSEVWVSCFLFGGFTNIFNPPDEKLIYFTYVQCNVVVVVKRGGFCFQFAEHSLLLLQAIAEIRCKELQSLSLVNLTAAAAGRNHE